jgi:hypothetical protein
MTWYVKAKAPDREVVKILCDEPNEVISNMNDQRKTARQVWIEDEDGKQMDEIFFTKMQGRRGPSQAPKGQKLPALFLN